MIKLKEFYQINNIIKLFALLMVFIPVRIMAQVALPYGITPINGELRLLFSPGFESKCSGSVEGVDTPLTSTTMVAINSIGSLSYSLNMDGVTAIFDINEDGFRLTDKPPIFKAENSGLVDSKIADLILDSIKVTPPGYGVIGKALRQGSNIEMSKNLNFCGAIQGAVQELKLFKRKAVGIANIDGRSSLIIRSEIEGGCTVDNIKVSVNLNGWESIDLQSGLQGNSTAKMVFKFDREESATVMKNQCIVSQLSTISKSNNSISKTVEQRLLEIKSLMEKGLITEEQYNQKRIDVLKSL